MQHFPLLYSSRILVICFLVSLSVNCSGSRTARSNPTLIESQQLVDQYGVVTTPQETQYLTYLEHRLVQSIPTQRRQEGGYEILLLDTEEPLAFSPGAGRILISKGLVQRLKTEGEFAFVVAHEISHQELGHVNQLEGLDVDQLSAVQHEYELAADKHAVGILALAGYDPRVAPFAIEHAYGSISRKATDTHPDIAQRISAVQAQLSNSTWRGVGTVDRRAYVKFRAALG